MNQFVIPKTCCDQAFGHSPDCAFTKMEKELKACRAHFAESVAKECKCETNTAVNHDLVNRNLKLKKALKMTQDAYDLLKEENENS